MTGSAQPVVGISAGLSQGDDAVLSCLRGFVEEASVCAAQRDLLNDALASLARTVAALRARGAVVPFFDLPIAVAHIAHIEEASARELASACGLVFLALDIFDDLADGDWREGWAGRGPGELQLAAATLLSAATSLIIARLRAPPATRVAMQERLSNALFRMSAGQQADLAMVDAVAVDPEEVIVSVAGKSGQQHALYCALAAQLGGLDPERIASFAEMGLHLGTAGQIASDCHELLCDPAMRDLANGTRTLPVALHLSRLGGPDRQAFLDKLGEAKHSDVARRAVREILQGRGAIRHALVRGAVFVQRARRAAERACPDPAHWEGEFLFR